jgi:hypothetical protein
VNGVALARRLNQASDALRRQAIDQRKPRLGVATIASNVAVANGSVCRVLDDHSHQVVVDLEPHLYDAALERRTLARSAVQRRRPSRW